LTSGSACHYVYSSDLTVLYIMEKMGWGFWILMAVSAVITACCAYMVYLGWQSDDRSGVWLFVAFGFFFAMPLLIGGFRYAALRHPRIGHLYDKAAETEEPQGTRFVPHWFMMTVIVIMGLFLLFLLVRGCITLIDPK
jgi:hypothetical protein